MPAGNPFFIGNIGIEMTSAVILDDTLNQLMFEYSASDYPHAILIFSVSKNSGRRTGTIIISTDGVDVSNIQTIESQPDPDITGITIALNVLAGNVQVKVSATNTGAPGTFKSGYIKRWD